ncbi:MAG: glycerol-3-phosphate 1-O-acyltransferase PlsY [Actinobacteria bacterium]|nr:MAG: glycerol-3-phosphate 1-O-acyltransferase PlsY [Actinomycetota bacterium]
MEYLLILVGCLLGSMPWGYWLPRLLVGVDIRSVGSGNVGGTNVWRALGWKYGVPVMLLDVGKGFAAALLGRWLGDDLVGVLAGCAAMAGHWRPLFLRFARGGKIVATTGGVGFAVAPLATLCAVVVWWIVFLPTRYVSIASMVSAISLPLFALVFDATWPVLAFTSGAAVAIVVLHRANIARLAAGTENRAQLRRSGRSAQVTRKTEASL